VSQHFGVWQKSVEVGYYLALVAMGQGDMYPAYPVGSWVRLSDGNHHAKYSSGERLWKYLVGSLTLGAEGETVVLPPLSVVVFCFVCYLLGFCVRGCIGLMMIQHTHHNNNNNNNNKQDSADLRVGAGAL
jgi:hypothetical protein